MYLRIMAQRFIVTYAHNGSGDCLLVCYAAMVKIRINAESFRYQRAEYLQLDLAHEPQMYLTKLFVPYHMELGVFLFKQTHFVKHIVGVNVSGKQHTVGEHRLDNRVARFAFGAQTLPCKGVRKTRHSAKRACGSCVHSAELCARIYPYLVHLALAHSVLYTQNAAGYFYVSEPCPALRGYLIYPCAEISAVFGHKSELLQACHQLTGAFQLQGRSEPAGENAPLCNIMGNALIGKSVRFEIFVHKTFTEKCKLTVAVIVRSGKISDLVG